MADEAVQAMREQMEQMQRTMKAMQDTIVRQKEEVIIQFIWETIIKNLIVVHDACLLACVLIKLIT